jgi:hypothetical protein
MTSVRAWGMVAKRFRRRSSICSPFEPGQRAGLGFQRAADKAVIESWHSTLEFTNLPDTSAEFVIGAYHRLYEIERSFRMSKHDLAARPICHQA